MYEDTQTPDIAENDKWLRIRFCTNFLLRHSGYVAIPGKQFRVKRIFH